MHSYSSNLSYSKEMDFKRLEILKNIFSSYKKNLKKMENNYFSLSLLHSLNNANNHAIFPTGKPTTEDYCYLLTAAWEVFFPNIPDILIYDGITEYGGCRKTVHFRYSNPVHFDSNSYMVAFETPDIKFANIVESMMSEPGTNPFNVYFWDHLSDNDGDTPTHINDLEILNESQKKEAEKTPFVYISYFSKYYRDEALKKRKEPKHCFNAKETSSTYRIPFESSRRQKYIVK